VQDEELTLTDKRADTSAPLHPIIAERWSPRALDPEGVVTDEQLRSMLEAARWAASYGDTQPARYLVGRRGDETFRRIHDVLVPGNQSWAHAAAVLMLGVAVTRNAKGDVPYAEYGMGLATQNLVLQAVADGLVAHQMAGFEPEAARVEFDLPESGRPMIAIAVGVLGHPSLLIERRRAREMAPRTRLGLDEIAFSGEWGRPLF
jgi:nitroreductase